MKSQGKSRKSVFEKAYEPCGQFADLRGVLTRKNWVVFFAGGGGGEGGYQNAHYDIVQLKRFFGLMKFRNPINV